MNRFSGLAHREVHLLDARWRAPRRVTATGEGWKMARRCQVSKLAQPLTAMTAVRRKQGTKRERDIGYGRQAAESAESYQRLSVATR